MGSWGPDLFIFFFFTGFVVAVEDVCDVVFGDFGAGTVLGAAEVQSVVGFSVVVDRCGVELCTVFGVYQPVVFVAVAGCWQPVVD